MPRFDGTGPQSQGPMTGRGEGYCAVEIPDGEQAPAERSALGARFARWMSPAAWFGGTFGRGRGASRGRGRRSGRR